MANDCIEADFSCEKDLKQLVEKLGQLSKGECTSPDKTDYIADRQKNRQMNRQTDRQTDLYTYQPTAFCFEKIKVIWLPMF